MPWRECEEVTHWVVDSFLEEALSREPMTLGEVIGALRDLCDDYSDDRVENGLVFPHSHRGDYFELAFEVGPTTLSEMRKMLESCVGKTFPGWKGGDYMMHEGTSCVVANQGECGQGITPLLLRFLLRTY